MSDITRRRFLRSVLPVLGAAAVAPTILVPERKVKRFWDMGAAWKRQEQREALSRKTRYRSAEGVELGEMTFKYDPDTHLWERARDDWELIQGVLAQAATSTPVALHAKVSDHKRVPRPIIKAIVAPTVG
jgi:hypothetical protein